MVVSLTASVLADFEDLHALDFTLHRVVQGQDVVFDNTKLFACGIIDL